MILRKKKFEYSYSGVIEDFNFDDKKLKKLVLLMTSGCNMRCRYCFLEYGEKASIGRNNFLETSVIENRIDDILIVYPEGIDYIEFFGGEPLLAYTGILEIIDTINNKFNRSGLKKPGYGMVTNGILLTPEKMKVFREKNVAVMVSIDGSKELQDSVRVGINGENTYEKLISNLSDLDLADFKDINFELTINREHLLNYKKGQARKWFQNLKELGFRVGNVGIVEFSLDKDLDFQLEDEEIFKNIEEEIVDFFFDEIKGDDPIFHLDIMRILRKIILKDFKPYSCGAGVSQLTLDVDGKFVPCTKLTANDFKMINLQAAENSRIKSVIESEYKSGCKDCWLENMCLGFCYATKYRIEEDDNHVYNRCWHAKYITEFIVKNIIKLQKSGEMNKLINGINIFNSYMKANNNRS